MRRHRFGCAGGTYPTSFQNMGSTPTQNTCGTNGTTVGSNGFVGGMNPMYGTNGTTTYQELDKEYRQYVKDVAELIRYVGLSSSKEVLLYLQALMETGHFAKNNDHKYQLFEHERDFVQELYGAKVLTGRSVCRHMSSFFVDVMNELKYTAANICTTPPLLQPIEDVINGKSQLNHQVVGIVECGRKLVFDPTCGEFSAESKDLDTPNIQFEICQVVIPETKLFLMMSPYSEYINPNNEQACTTMNKTKLGRITSEEVKYLKNKIERVC